jgi:hypothetical protein
MTPTHLGEQHSSFFPSQPSMLHKEGILTMNRQEMLWLDKPQHLLQLTLKGVTKV